MKVVTDGNVGVISKVRLFSGRGRLILSTYSIGNKNVLHGAVYDGRTFLGGANTQIGIEPSQGEVAAVSRKALRVAARTCEEMAKQLQEIAEKVR